MRIRRKFALILSSICVSVFIFLYFLINNSIPIDKQQNLRNIEDKLKQLENGLYLHHEEMGQIKRQINGKTADETNYRENQIIHPKLKLDKKEMFNEMIINVDDTEHKCPIAIENVPKPDIQMLELYKKIPFDNVDGGSWKQGWRIEYDPLQFNKHHKLKVFVVPHSHNDPGWIKTFDDYYEHDTKQILSNMLRHLSENPDMTFIWAEISYFSRWFESLSKNSTNMVKKLLQRHQLEFVTGGWVMSDEANSHWLSILMQLTEGQTWLKINLNVTPTASWSIDPFGQSSTMPYILKNSDIKNLLIQRTHYSIKKALAQKKQLEFRWRQTWDGLGDTDLFTHMMPFYSYDIPHTCGPDPKVCCQFDFKRLQGFGLSCPWKVSPQVIDERNVAKRAELILDQWRKKSMLYRTRSILIPLGDDFRYSQSTEWEAQRKNYEKLFDYMNNEPDLFVQAKFGTLQEYFDSVYLEKDVSEFPSLSGDFFTYADRDDHYWSGYYTSRPYHKRMDRVLLHYIRSAEMIHAWHNWEQVSEFDDMLTKAKRALSLFQHHDGITGTAKNHVVRDYASKMFEAVNICKFIIQQAAYRLLTKPNIYAPDYKFNYFYLDDSRWPGPNDSRTTIILGEELPTKYVVFHNSLPQWRAELIELYVSKPYVKVTDFENRKVEAEISPVWSWHKGFSNTSAPQPSATKFRLLFKVKLPPLGLRTYIIHNSSPDDINTGTTFAKIKIYTDSPFSVNLAEYPLQAHFAQRREISLHLGDGPIASFSLSGLLKSLSINADATSIPTHLEFFKYGTRHSGPVSGAYLFLPDGPATPVIIGDPTILVTQGIFESNVMVGLPFGTHQTIVRDGAIEIKNLIDINNMGNTEIVMRISTNIKSDDVFYTDLNGFQVLKRKRFSKIPLQANYYPIPSCMYIEEDHVRLTLLSAQPLGGSSLQSGQIEIMQDRRLEQDDERGLGQGVTDNQPVIHIFRLLLENIEPCSKRSSNYPNGFLTVHAQKELQTLLYPVNKLIWNENEWVGAEGSFGNDNEPFEEGIDLSVMRNLPHIHSNKKEINSIGLVVFRPYVEYCTTDGHREGIINIKRLLNLKEETDIYSSSLTLLNKTKMLKTNDVSLCPMDVKAFIIQR